MQKMAKEMNDSKALANYNMYEQRIAKAAAVSPNRGMARKSESDFYNK